MKLIPETDVLELYLESTELVDYDHASVRRLASRLIPDSGSDTDKVRAVFEYMQASTPHSINAGLPEVARRASDVVRLGHGICYAKANLFAALMRSQGIPTGFCYEKYRIDGTPGSKFVLHCLNAVYLGEYDCWVRIDVRTVDEGFDPAFRPGEDSGIFHADPTMGEEEYPWIYVRPVPSTVEALMKSRDTLELHDKLPESL
jgi:hypothetical protein